MIFYDNTDRDNFLARLGSVLTETGRPCFAWALIPNHLHLLIRTGSTPIATVMRRRLAGQAVTFNRRRRRHGQLFQNRYKSTLCQEDLNRKSQLEATGYGLDWMVGRVARQREVEPKVVLDI
jgi:REP element-mobilizing transposase RayT